MTTVNSDAVARGERIRKLRTARGLTQMQLAKMLGGSTEAVVSRLERAYSNDMTYNMANKLAKIFNTTPEYILEGVAKAVVLDHLEDNIVRYIADPKNSPTLTKFVLEQQIKEIEKAQAARQ